MSSSKSPYLLDLNALIALGNPDHMHHRAVQTWFISSGNTGWGVCPLTEAGFVRITTNPAYRPAARTLDQAKAVLSNFAAHPGYRYWPITQSWAELTAPFSARIMGHRQITDAYLLGIAVQGKGVLVTFDKAIRYLAGAEFSRNLLVLDSR